MKYVPLRYLAAVVAGQSPPSESVVEWSRGTPFLQGNADFGTTNPTPRWECANPPKRCQAGDLLISVRAPVGALNWADQPYGIGRGLAAIRPFDHSAARFLMYALRANLHLLKSVATGSTFTAVTADDLKSIAVPAMERDEQWRIADFLDDQVGRLDAAIQLGTQRRALLEQARTAALADCFAGGSTSKHLSEHSMLGRIPSDWPVQSLKRVCERIGVGVVVNPSSYFSLEGVPFLHGGNVRDGFFDLTDVKRISEDDSRRLDRSRLRAGDVLVVRAGYPGRSAVVTPELAGANCASMLLIRPSSVVLPDWLSGFFNSPQGRQQVSVAQYGAAQEQINVGDVVDFQIPVPPVEAQQAQLQEAHRIIGDASGMASLAMRQEALLQERKQALIMAAVTGQFDITTARAVA